MKKTFRDYAEKKLNHLRKIYGPNIWMSHPRFVPPKVDMFHVLQVHGAIAGIPTKYSLYSYSKKPFPKVPDKEQLYDTSTELYFRITGV